MRISMLSCMQAQWSVRLPAILALLATQGSLLASQVGPVRYSIDCLQFGTSDFEEESMFIGSWQLDPLMLE